MKLKSLVLVGVLCLVQLVGAQNPLPPIEASIAEWNQVVADRDAAVKAVATIQPQLVQAQAQVQSLTQQLVSAQAQAAADQSTISDLQVKVSDLLGKLAQAQLQVTDLQGQLAAAQAKLLLVMPGKYFPNLQSRPDWSAGSTGPLIGGGVPKDFSRTWDSSGNLVLSTTGNIGEYDDWLTALHLPVIAATDSYLRIDYSFVLDANQAAVQCHEFDVLMVNGGVKYNGSAQIDYSKGGLLDIANGVGGGWIDTTVPKFGRPAAGPHTMLWEYAFNQSEKTLTYLAFTLDDKRYPLYLTQPASATTWGNGKLHIQLQEDTNKLGTQFQTIYTGVSVIIH